MMPLRRKPRRKRGHSQLQIQTTPSTSPCCFALQCGFFRCKVLFMNCRFFLRSVNNVNILRFISAIQTTPSTSPCCFHFEYHMHSNAVFLLSVTQIATGHQSRQQIHARVLGSSAAPGTTSVQIWRLPCSILEMLTGRVFSWQLC
jgi:hypothetical protein